MEPRILLVLGILTVLIVSGCSSPPNADTNPTINPGTGEGLVETCNDGTLYGRCSENQLYCDNGTLVKNAIRCECPLYKRPDWVDSPPRWNLSTPTQEKNPKWYTNNLTYTFQGNCTKTHIEKTGEAFAYLLNNTNTSLTFKEVYSYECPDIKIDCLNITDLEETTIGLSTFSYYNESEYTIIVGSEINLTIGDQLCPKPNLQLHEILHVFGFDHTGDGSDIMYKRYGCMQTLKDGLKNDLAQIYPR